ncbi:MAG: AMP-binding protein [Candidatus Aenigmatarchaeota archaeon]
MFDKLGVKPEDIREPKDLLEKLPIITREDIINAQPPLSNSFKFFSAPPGYGFTRPYTSGTSGSPKITRRTFDDWDSSRERCARGYTMVGILPTDVVLDMLPFGINVSGLASLFGFYRTVGAEVITLGVSLYPKKTDIFSIHRPTVIFGMASYVDRLARELKLGGLDTEKLGIRTILVVGEPSTKEKRDRISEAFGGAKVYDWYASDEGDVMAVQCKPNIGSGNENDLGMHVNEDRILMFVINKKTRSEEAKGNVGIDVITTLLDEGEYSGMVLLNYSHGDQFAIISTDTCEYCGRCLKRISHPTRERDEILIGPAKLPLSDVEAAINSSESRKYLTGEYEIVYHFDEIDRLYKVTIRVDTLGSVEHNFKQRIANQIRDKIFAANYPISVVTQQSQIGELNIEVVDEGSLEVYKSPGKPRRIIKV